jgi:hypothetical protein
MSAPAMISKDALAEILRRFGVAHSDDALIGRAQELYAAAAEQMGRLPADFDKSLEPLHIFKVPHR